MFPLFPSLHLVAHLCQEVEGCADAGAWLPVRDSLGVSNCVDVDDVTRSQSP